MAAPTDIELRLDASRLYREEVFTDQRIGTIHQLIPVKSDGAPDPGRPVVFTGQTQILTAGGALPPGPSAARSGPPAISSPRTASIRGGSSRRSPAGRRPASRLARACARACPCAARTSST